MMQSLQACQHIGTIRYPQRFAPVDAVPMVSCYSFWHPDPTFLELLACSHADTFGSFKGVESASLSLSPRLTFQVVPALCTVINDQHAKAAKSIDKAIIP